MLPIEQAEQILEGIGRDANRFASQRSSDYLQKRLQLEGKTRGLFEEKGSPERYIEAQVWDDAL